MAKPITVNVIHDNKDYTVTFSPHRAKLAKAALKAVADNPGISWDAVCDIIGRRKMTADEIRGDLIWAELMLPPCHSQLWSFYPEEFYITDKGRDFLTA